MHRSLNSTEVLSKTYSRVKMAESSLRQGSPVSRPFSSRSKNHGDSLLHESLISKNKKLSMMIRTVHGYMTNIEQLDWIMGETETIIKNYIKTTAEKSSVSHKIQIQNIYTEITKLINRFSGIDKKWIVQMTIPLKENKRLKNSENFNMMNFKKTETIGSFKCTDTENQQQGVHLHTDFSKIKLPSIIKENQTEQNMQSYREDQEAKIRQFQGAIEVLKSQIQSEKRQKNQIKRALQEKINGLHKKIQLCHSQWQMYKTYAASCIKKCKNYLSQIGQEGTGNGRVENMLDQLFCLQNKLDRKILESNVQDIQAQKQVKIRELMGVEEEIKAKRDQIDKIQTQRTKLNTQKKGMEDTELTRLLYIQATTIERLL